MTAKKATKRKPTKAEPPSADFRKISAFEWNDQTSAAAVALSEGKTQQEVAKEVGVTDRTIRNWLAEVDFAAEVDRLSVMTGIAGRAERLRVAKRVIRTKTAGVTPLTDKDLLEWLKYAQSETDGIKLDLAAFAAAFGQDETSVAEGGQRGSGEAAADSDGGS